MWRAKVAAIDIRVCRSLLLLSFDGKLGDAILLSSLVRSVKATAPAVRIFVATTPNLAEYWSACENIQNVFVVPSRDLSMFVRLRALRRLAGQAELANIDVALSFDPIPMIDYFAFLHWLQADAIIGLSVTQYSLFRISIPDPVLEVPRRHAGERIVRTLASLGIATDLDQLKGLVPRSSEVAMQRRGEQWARPRIFLNGFGASTTRTFSATQLAAVARELIAQDSTFQLTINANAEQRTSPELRQLCADQPSRVQLFRPDATICDLLDAIAGCIVVLTPDTGVAHGAVAARTPLVVVFDDVEYNPICWRPLDRHAVCLLPERPEPISCMPVDKILEGIRQFLVR